MLAKQFVIASADFPIRRLGWLAPCSVVGPLDTGRTATLDFRAVVRVLTIKPLHWPNNPYPLGPTCHLLAASLVVPFPPMPKQVWIQHQAVLRSAFFDDLPQHLLTQIDSTQPVSYPLESPHSRGLRVAWCAPALPVLTCAPIALAITGFVHPDIDSLQPPTDRN